MDRWKLHDTGLPDGDAAEHWPAALVQAIADATPDAILVVDSSGAIAHANASAVQMFGYPREVLVGMSVDALVPARFRGAHAAHREAYRRAAAPRPMGIGRDLVARRADGSELPVDVSLAPLRASGAATIAVVRDASERVRAAAELARTEAQLRHAQKMDAIGRLAGGVAHDFNNMLTVILAEVDALAARVASDAEAAASASAICSATLRASRLTQQLLAMSRQQVVAPRLVDANAVVCDAQALLGRVVGEEIAIVAEPSREPVPVVADRGQLDQVLLNLVLNARDAMPAGGTIHLAARVLRVAERRHLARAELPPGEYVQLSVRDTGQGIDAEALARIFEPFFTTKPAGSGLGLSIVYGIVTQSGGRIDVTTERGRGSTFDVYLPRAAEGAAAVAVPPVRDARARGRERHGTALVVDDEPLVRRGIVRLLERAGFVALDAPSGESALALLAGGDAVDVLVTDVVMPGMSGPELATRALEASPALRVVFMSAHPLTATRMEAAAVRAHPYLQKPFSRDALIAAVQDALAT